MKRLFLAIALLMWAGVSEGATVYAKPSTDNTSLIKYKANATSCDDASGWTDNTDLEAALAAAGAGGTLNICAGTYATTMIDATDGLDTTGTNQTISGIGTAVLDGTGLADHIIYNPHAGLTVNDITIQNSDPAVNKFGSYIGASATFNRVNYLNNNMHIYMSSGGAMEVVFNRCKFYGATNTGYWGINYSAGVTATFNYPWIENNKAGFRAYETGTITWNNPLFIGEQGRTYNQNVKPGSTPTTVFNNAIMAANASAGVETQYTIFHDGGTITSNNGIILANGLSPANYRVSGTLTENSGVNANPRFKSGRRNALVVLMIDDSTNINHWADIADYAKSAYGYSTTIAVWGTKGVDAAGWAKLAARTAQGHEVAVHGTSSWKDNTAEILDNTLIGPEITAIQANIPGYTVTSAAYPHGARDTTAIDYLKGYNSGQILGARAVNDASTDHRLGDGVSIFEIRGVLTSSAIGNGNIARNVASIMEYAKYSGAVVCLFDHRPEDYSLANWKTVIDEVAKSGASVMTLSQAIAWIKANGTTADDGYTYTVAYATDASDYRLTASSPAINAGVDVGLTTDFLGNPIKGLPDIGAYEFQGGVTRFPSFITFPSFPTFGR